MAEILAQVCMVEVPLDFQPETLTIASTPSLARDVETALRSAEKHFQNIGAYMRLRAGEEGNILEDVAIAGSDLDPAQRAGLKIGLSVKDTGGTVGFAIKLKLQIREDLRRWADLDPAQIPSGVRLKCLKPATGTNTSGLSSSGSARPDQLIVLELNGLLAGAPPASGVGVISAHDADWPPYLAARRLDHSHKLILFFRFAPIPARDSQ